MEDPKEFLIEFMTLKQSLFSRIDKNLPSYFLPADVEAIRGRSDENAATVVKIIYLNLCGYISEFGGFSAKTHPLMANLCPFCELDDMECEECEYGKVHGVCTKPDSNFRVLEQALEESHDCQFNTFNKEIKELIKKYS